MALIKCKECGNEISDMATVCPHCGIAITVENENADVSSNNEAVVENNKKKKKKEKKKENFFYKRQIDFMYAIPLLLLIICALLGCWTGPMSMFYIGMALMIICYISSFVFFILFLVKDKESKKVGSIIRGIVAIIFIVILIGQCHVRSELKAAVITYESAANNLILAVNSAKLNGFNKETADISFLTEAYEIELASKTYDVALRNVDILDWDTLAELRYRNNAIKRVNSSVEEVVEYLKSFQ